MNVAVKVALSDDFLQAFSRLPRDKQQGVMRFLSKFRQNPTASGINYERIRQALDDGIHSVRIDQDYRGIVLRPENGNVYCLLWVDKHDNAYDWARRHRVAVNPELGNIQVFETSYVEGQDDVQPAAAPEPAAAEGLFAGLKDRELVRLGVPEECIPKVRSVSDETGLDALQKILPDDGYEALFMFAAGEGYESLVRDREAPTEVDTQDYAAALERVETRRHFVLITDDSDLDALLAAPLAKWRVFLHPAQRKLVERDWNGPVRVLGGAGTGKTVAAMHRAVWLARQYLKVPGRPVLFTTFTKTLAKDIQAQLAMVASPEERDRIQVVHMDQWAIGILRKHGFKENLLFSEPKRRELWKMACTCAPVDLDLPEEFYQAEFERVVLPQGCETVDDYKAASRIGRGVQLNRAKRIAIWPVFAEYRSLLRRAGFREAEEAYRDALALMKQERDGLGIRAVVIDETQDLSASALALLRAAVPEGPNDMFLVGDAHQRIYRHKVVLSRIGINIQGRGRRLRVNYRTTDEIRRWAVAQLANCSIDDLDGQPDTLVGYQSLTHGSAPDVRTSKTTAQERPLIEQAIAQLLADGIPQQGICIASRTNADSERYEQLCRGAGYEVRRLSSDAGDDADKPGIRIATMHRVKGLEFDAMIIAGYKGPEAYTERFAEDEDAGVVVDTLTSERSLLHVAATRAKRYLMVSILAKS
ncbi:MAG: DEAD/DEAH box helicase [Gammaproteobacteria bacterium]|nr:DEAD/DEAH box helicase [Gammaproteobacteria bacterium]